MRPISGSKLPPALFLPALVLLSVLLNGCATSPVAVRAYSGVALPDEQVAKLTYLREGVPSYTASRVPNFLHPVWVEKIDGKDHIQLCESNGQELTWFDQHNRWQSLWMLPAGEHTVQVGGLPDYAKVGLYFENRDSLRSTLDPHAQVCMTSGDNCIVTGSWQMTFSSEPLHTYAIGVEFGEEIYLAREETGGIMFLVGHPPWPSGTDWSATADQIAVEMLASQGGSGSGDLRTHDLAMTGTTTGGLMTRLMRPYLQDVTTGRRVGQFQPIRERE